MGSSEDTGESGLGVVVALNWHALKTAIDINSIKNLVRLNFFFILFLLIVVLLLGRRRRAEVPCFFNP